MEILARREHIRDAILATMQYYAKHKVTPHGIQPYSVVERMVMEISDAWTHEIRSCTWELASTGYVSPVSTIRNNETTIDEIRGLKLTGKGSDYTVRRSYQLLRE